MVRTLSRRSALLGLLGPAVLIAAPSLAAETPPLAIKGFDPVAYFTVGSPILGLVGIEYLWDEQLYRFSRVEHRDLFIADPVRYAPQFASFCAMALALGKIVEADPEHWLISDGKLYIFGKVTGPDMFKRDLNGNISRANRNRARLEKN